MRKLIIFLVFLVSIFIINYVFYVVSEDYRFFLKKIKDSWGIVYLDQTKVKTEIDKKEENALKDIQIIEVNKKNEEIFSINEEDEVELKDEVELWKSYKKILSKFATYDLKKLEVNTNLFDLTDEYPDNYLEYYWENLTLYFFPTKKYSDLVDIFKVLEYELPFIVKEVDNFGEASFYVNLDKDIQDRFIRLVISYEWVAFWIKVKKTDYDLVKAKLLLLKPKTKVKIINNNENVNDNNIETSIPKE